MDYELTRALSNCKKEEKKMWAGVGQFENWKKV